MLILPRVYGFSWRGNHNRELATVTIPAPFGYLDELTQMKDAAAQNAMNSLQKSNC